MPVSPVIYAGVHDVASPLASMEEVAKLKNAQLGQQLAQIKLNAAQREEQEKVKAEQTRTMLATIIGHHLNEDGSVKREGLTQEVPPQYLPDVMTALDAFEETRQKAIKATNDSTLSAGKIDEAHAEVAGRLGRMGQILLNNEDPENAAGMVAMGIASGVKSGLIKQEEAEAITRKLDPRNPQELKRTIDALQAADPKGLQEAQKTAIESEQAAAMGPLKLREAAAKATSAEQDVTGTAPISMAEQARLAIQKAGLARQDRALSETIRHDKAMEEKQKAEEGVTGGAKLSATAIEKIAGIDQSLGILESLEKSVNDDWLGPVAGRIAENSVNFPGVKVSDELARFSAETSTLKNAVVKAITGAQMSEAEAKRIMQQVPTFSDKPNVWREKVNATKQNLKTLKNRTIELSGGTVPAEIAPTGDAYQRYLQRTKGK